MRAVVQQMLDVNGAQEDSGKDLKGARGIPDCNLEGHLELKAEVTERQWNTVEDEWHTRWTRVAYFKRVHNHVGCERAFRLSFLLTFSRALSNPSGLFAGDCLHPLSPLCRVQH